MRRIGVVLLTCLIACAGCSSSAGNGESRKTLESVLLQLSDFPPTWRSFPPPAETGDLLGDLAACTGDAADAKSTVTVHSGEFRRGEQYITSTAVSYEHRSALSRVVGALGDAKAERCMAQAIRPRVLAHVPQGKITSERFTVRQGGLNVSITYAGDAAGVVTATADGRPERIYVDAVFFVALDFHADITFIGVGDRVPTFIRNALSNDVAHRAEHT